MYRQPRKADYIEFMRAQGLKWSERKMRLCIEEAEYDEVGDIVNWYAGETYEGRTLRNAPANFPLMLDVRDEHGDKVDDFCIIIDPATGEILDAWSETDPDAHSLLKEIGLGKWDNIPQPPPPASPDQILDMIWEGSIEPSHHKEGRFWKLPSGAHLWEIREQGELRGYGADSEAAGYLEEMLKHHFSPRDAMRRILIELERAEELKDAEEFEIDFEEEDYEPSPEEISPEIYDALDNLGAASVPCNDYTLSEIKALAQRLTQLLGGAQ